MFTWAALSRDQHPLCEGISGDLAAAKRACAAFVTDGRALLAYVTEVRSTLDAGLGREYEPTGSCWWGKLTAAGEMRWFPSPMAAVLHRP